MNVKFNRVIIGENILPLTRLAFQEREEIVSEAYSIDRCELDNWNVLKDRIYSNIENVVLTNSIHWKCSILTERSSVFEEGRLTPKV